MGPMTPLGTSSGLYMLALKRLIVFMKSSAVGVFPLKHFVDKMLINSVFLKMPEKSEWLLEQKEQYEPQGRHLPDNSSCLK